MRRWSCIIRCVFLENTNADFRLHRLHQLNGVLCHSGRARHSGTSAYTVYMKTMCYV